LPLSKPLLLEGSCPAVGVAHEYLSGRKRQADMRGYDLLSQDSTSILEKAKDLHGHFGPFLVIGVRAGLIGLRELRTIKENKDLSATASLAYSVPYSCILDGIQIAAGCTVGNKRLRFEDSSDFSISFENETGETVTVSILPRTLDELKRKLVKDIPSEEVEKLAFEVISMAERELFTVDRRQATSQQSR